MFQKDGGSTLYSYSNRTSVTYDVSLLTTFILFGTVFTAFLLIFPGIRKQKWSTFFTVALIVFVGMTINVAMLGSTWHISSAKIVSQYSIYSKQKISAMIGGYIGLMHINITYEVLPVDDVFGDVKYNERFYWRQPEEMTNNFKDSLRRGSPFPIISLAEYFTLNQEGFSWGGEYRQAGYYASAMLWTSLASWLMMNLMLLMVPRYSAYCMVITGLCMLLTNFVYYSLLPSEPLVAHINGTPLKFGFGWCYWLVFIAGISCLVAGVIISAMDMIFPHSFSTILEIDYDTPYDRHVIIEESCDTQRKDIRKNPYLNKNSFENQLVRNVSSKLTNVNTNCNEETGDFDYIYHSSNVHEETFY